MSKDKQIIFVTGASSGMGKDMALELIKRGHVVYGAARRVNKMQELVDNGGHSIEMDVTDEAAIKVGVERIIREQGTIDVLINNAGYGLYGAVEDIDLQTARHQFDVNIFGLAAVTKEVLPHMREQNYGRIINISSMGGRVYTPLGAWYHATKHALEGWSDCLRLELKQFNIDVVIIQPGVINTEFGEVLMDPMIERSKGSPYEEMAQKIAKATADTYSNDAGSKPEVITNLIVKAVESDKPKTRYIAGKFAKPMVYLRKFIGDRTFDKLIMSQVK